MTKPITPYDRPRTRKKEDLFQLEVMRYALAISIALQDAITYYASSEEMGTIPTILEQVKRGGTPLSAIWLALHQSTVLALCRIWERQPDTANLPLLKDRLGRSRIQQDLSEALQKQFDINTFHAWAADVEAMARSKEVRAIKRVRNELYAHRSNPNELSKSQDGPLDKGDEQIVIEKTASLLVTLKEMIGNGKTDYLDDQKKLITEAKAFWAKYK